MNEFTNMLENTSQDALQHLLCFLEEEKTAAFIVNEIIKTGNISDPNIIMTLAHVLINDFRFKTAAETAKPNEAFSLFDWIQYWFGERTGKEHVSKSGVFFSQGDAFLKNLQEYAQSFGNLKVDIPQEKYAQLEKGFEQFNKNIEDLKQPAVEGDDVTIDEDALHSFFMDTAHQTTALAEDKDLKEYAAEQSKKWIQDLSNKGYSPADINRLIKKQQVQKFIDTYAPVYTFSQMEGKKGPKNKDSEQAAKYSTNYAATIDAYNADTGTGNKQRIADAADMVMGRLAELRDGLNVGIPYHGDMLRKEDKLVEDPATEAGFYTELPNINKETGEEYSKPYKVPATKERDIPMPDMVARNVKSLQQTIDARAANVEEYGQLINNRASALKQYIKELPAAKEELKSINNNLQTAGSFEEQMAAIDSEINKVNEFREYYKLLGEQQASGTVLSEESQLPLPKGRGLNGDV